MKYIDMKAPGSAHVLHVAEMATPVAGAGELLIAVAATGINRPDIIQRQGLYPPPPGSSPILGLEVSGTVVQVGEGVAGWLPVKPC